MTYTISLSLLESNTALPILISNFVTIVLIVFFGRDRIQQKEAYKAQVVHLEAKALKAQMNPHFIFNTLNSIQSVMFLEDEKKANFYLGLFSSLLRKTLDMSISEIDLPLIDELDYIKDYVDLQNLRLNQPIKLLIDVDPSIDIQTFKIAPMMIQPIVENAILHGISALKRKGVISIKITQTQDTLVVHVEDNGIGKRKAQALKNTIGGDVQKRKSHATNILRERIDGFNYLHKINCEFYLEDILENKQIVGTRAVLRLPKIIQKN